MLNAISFRLHSDSLSQASQLFERAVSGVMKKCALLYFTYADFEEQNMKFEKVQCADGIVIYNNYFFISRCIRSTATFWRWNRSIQLWPMSNT